MTALRRAAGAVTLLLVLAGTCKADYAPLEVFDMLGSSDVVVVGTITKLDAESYELKVEQTLAGAKGKQTLTIQRFRDWTCASRYAPYAVGQKLLVCANRQPLEDGKGHRLRIRSAGGEGEMPITDGKLLIRGSTYPRERLKQPVPLAEAVAAIRGLRTHYRFTLKREAYAYLIGVRQTASAEDLVAYHKSSELAALLVDTVAAYLQQKRK